MTTDHVPVRGVEDLVYQGEVLSPHSPLNLEQVSVHPGLVLKHEHFIYAKEQNLNLADESLVIRN